ncbi:hypothetical protein [Oceaniglobus trochenteri]|uniref:hypothetical protein n=1 Tax=Oceaniglobus trochenteri TaxID=2763260 RepID=UPI001CFFA60C|nr:hypothetical protein [Oceaniglobus trochenteri]
MPMTRPTIPKGRMTIRKAKQRWQDVWDAAQEGHPQKMADAVSRFQSIAETFFMDPETLGRIEGIEDE